MSCSVGVGVVEKGEGASMKVRGEARSGGVCLVAATSLSVVLICCCRVKVRSRFLL
jgi:hypothetical protein